MRHGQRRFSHSVYRWLPVQYPYIIPLWDRLEQVLRIGFTHEEKAVIVQDRQEGKPGNDPQFCTANSAFRAVSLCNSIHFAHPAGW
jgi:hypothetical protein